MVHYHSTRLVWYSGVMIGLLLVLICGVVIMGFLLNGSRSPSADTWWMVVLAAVPVTTAVVWVAKTLILKRVSAEWPLFRGVLWYKRVLLGSFSAFLAIGAFVCGVALFVEGGLTHYLAIIVVPLGAMVMNLPNLDKVTLFIDDVLTRTEFVRES